MEKALLGGSRQKSLDQRGPEYPFVKAATPLHFVSTCDIIGGNSGSPVINKSGQIVGLIFDGNIESLVGRYVYNGTDNRAVAVDTAAMTEALRKLYGAQDLANEMMPGKFPATQ
jgi:hypothetical protein